MSHQLTFADSEFSTKRRQTRKEIFLSRMEQILPWQNMTAVIEPFYPKAGNGRRPYPLETMLRIHCLQHWYNLSDGAMEDALYEIASMRLFARLSLDSALPDRTTIMNFRHLLEQRRDAGHRGILVVPRPEVPRHRLAQRFRRLEVGESLAEVDRALFRREAGHHREDGRAVVRQLESGPVRPVFDPT